ncbi:MAG TPA: hypothetical protein VJX29_14335 [Candidatus Acidoferrales bacterium]|nr:hypothetical protein [Candidatus Acidoferrales bacterium]
MRTRSLGRACFAFHWSRRTIVQRAVCALAGLLAAFPTARAAQQPPISPDEIVGKTVANELAAADDSGHYLYRLKKETPEFSETDAVIETKDWLIKRRLMLNGKPLTSKQEEEEEKRLQSLIADPEKLQKMREEQRKHERRVRELVQALPAAFQYEYDSEEQRERGHQLIELKFHPNPAYNPPSRELQILRGMDGTMVVDATVYRLVRVQARLIRRVNFAWGILGHLDQGGSFLLEQQDVGVGRWQFTLLALHFTGKILFFKTINIDSTVRTSDLRRLKGDLTLVQGLELLRVEAEHAQPNPATGPPR